MKNLFHILNGDALKNQFPNTIEGELIICRECLVDGPVKADSLDEFYEVRADFISTSYAQLRADYFNSVVTEFDKIKTIPEDADIVLWFEDDLFCQVNFWFILNFIFNLNMSQNIYLVRPESHSQFGFSAYTKDELFGLFQNKIELNELENLSKLWMFYQISKFTDLKMLAESFRNQYPFILDAVDLIDEAKPKAILLQIMNEKGSSEFGIVFREFCRKASIYGYGDLQVKRMFDEILRENKSLI